LSEVVRVVVNPHEDTVHVVVNPHEDKRGGSARAQRTIPKGARDEAESPQFINHLPKSPRNSLTIQNLTVNLFHNTLKINRKQSFICLLPRIKIIYIFAAI
jgi:hypothetical protein